MCKLKYCGRFQRLVYMRKLSCAVILLLVLIVRNDTVSSCLYSGYAG